MNQYKSTIVKLRQEVSVLTQDIDRRHLAWVQNKQEISRLQAVVITLKQQVQALIGHLQDAQNHNLPTQERQLPRSRHPSTSIDNQPPTPIRINLHLPPTAAIQNRSNRPLV